MASFHLFLLLCSFTSLLNQFHAQIISNLPSNSLLLPVTRDPGSLQYLTQIYHGTATPRVPIKLVVDLGGPFLWLDCASRPLSSSSRRLIPRLSIQCSTAMPFSDLDTSTCFSVNRTTCHLSTKNTITRSTTARGDLAQDILTFQSVGGSKPTVNSFLFSCAPKFLLNGLASGVQGMLGLGRTRIAVPSQLTATFGFQRKFATCLSSSNGIILFGNEPAYDSIFGAEISRSLFYTPLVANPDSSTSSSSQEYFILVKSIKINGKRSLSLSQGGIVRATKISTTVPYTTMDGKIYTTFIELYMEAAACMNITRVAPVEPFGLCFSSEGIASSLSGPLVPTIDLVLQSAMVKWRINGRNAMVPVSDEVMCLGFLDGGSNSKASIVIGGLQLEDTLLEFNLGTSMLGFSSFPVTRQTSCSNFALQSMLKGSL